MIEIFAAINHNIMTDREKRNTLMNGTQMHSVTIMNHEEDPQG